MLNVLRRSWICSLACGLAAVALLPAALASGGGVKPNDQIRVGILHSMTGTMAISEKAVVDATLLAIDEINASGGLLGRRVVPTLRDGASDWPRFAREAEGLVRDTEIVAVFGCWTSASRKSVRPIFERAGHLLFYPVQYEGMEISPTIIYTGAAPNQQIIPAVKWALDNVGRRFFLVGSDYVFPRMANEVIRDQLGTLKAEVVGERYLPLGSQDVATIVAEIVAKKPDVILNTINGDTNVAFFKALRAAGITPKQIPTISFSIGENELVAMDRSQVAGDYAVWNYFQSISTERNQRFVAAFKARYGADRVVSDPMEAAYDAVYLWAAAVRRAGTADVASVREALLGRVFDAPGGPVYVDPLNHHLWKTVRVGRIRDNGQFDIVWESPKPIRPQPFPASRPQAQWEAAVDELFRRWGGQWAAPAGAKAVQ
jgi:urea transport system substrate-binding protein